jgi:hypothetical protein
MGWRLGRSGAAPLRGLVERFCGKTAAQNSFRIAEWIDRNECDLSDGCDYPPANFFLATGRANAFVGPCPLLAITLP